MSKGIPTPPPHTLPCMHTQGQEQKVHDLRALTLIFNEMTFNVVYAMYPVSFEEAAALAAVHLYMEKGPRADKAAIKYAQRVDGKTNTHT